MFNESRLVVGQVIQYGPALYRVTFVNDCRALIVPLSKRHVRLPNGHEFDADREGISIAATSYVKIIEDLEAARDAIELEQVEEELRSARAELAARADAAPTAPHAPAKRPAGPPAPVPPGGGWHQAPGAAPTFKEGTLAAVVWAHIGAHPGQSTKAIVEGVAAQGAVAACVSRFHQAGLIEKRLT